MQDPRRQNPADRSEAASAQKIGTRPCMQFVRVDEIYRYKNFCDFLVIHEYHMDLRPLWQYGCIRARAAGEAQGQG